MRSRTRCAPWRSRRPMSTGATHSGCHRASTMSCPSAACARRVCAVSRASLRATSSIRPIASSDTSSSRGRRGSVLQIDPRHRRRQRAECAQPTNATSTPAAPDATASSALAVASCRPGVAPERSSHRDLVAPAALVGDGVNPCADDLRSPATTNWCLLRSAARHSKVTSRKCGKSMAEQYSTNGHGDTDVGKCRRTIRAERFACHTQPSQMAGGLIIASAVALALWRE